MRPLRGIVFDCDGVLFESRRANLAYYNAILSQLGVPPVAPDDHQRAHLCHTAASPKVFEVLLGSERVSTALDLAQNLDYRQFIPWMTPEPDLARVLSMLATRLPLGIATNRGNSMLEVLNHFQLQSYFQVVVTSRDVPRPKPYPDMLILAAQRLGIAPAELIFVGDSELDRQAAAAAGMQFVTYGGERGVADWVGSHQELWVMVRSQLEAEGASADR